MGDSSTNPPLPSSSGPSATGTGANAGHSGELSAGEVEQPAESGPSRSSGRSGQLEPDLAAGLKRDPAPKETATETASWSGAAVEAEAQDPLLGTTLHDTYTVVRVLGEGGMGRVYEARHTRIEAKRYAIKVLHSEFSLNPELRLRFQREAEAAATIDHSGVVGIYDVGKTPEGWPYMVCEYLAGEDLHDYQDRHGPLPAQTVVHIGKQLCSALGAAHERGVIHRDLKPHNIFVVKDDDKTTSTSGAPDLPRVKVLDFGLSRFVERDHELTKTGIILGTPGYMAPEQANGLHTDHRTDIYGIGALLYAAVTGHPPFKEETPQQTVLAVMGREPPRPRDRCPSIPLGLEIVIQKAMARRPEDRYQTAMDMEVALERLYAASLPLDRRGMRTDSSLLLSPRTKFVGYGTAALLFAVFSLTDAGLGLLQIKNVDYRHFHLSALEWILFVVLALLLLLPAVWFIRRFKQGTWNNSARIAELVVPLRAGLVAGVLAYGTAMFTLHSMALISGIGGSGADPSELASRPIVRVILPILAALAASAALLQRAVTSAHHAFVRAFASVGYPLGALASGLVLLTLPLSFQQKKTHPVETPSRSSAPAAEPTTEPGAQVEEPQDPKERGVEEALPASSPRPAAAPRADLAIATEEGALALEELSKKYPDDGKVLKALVLAHASRADTLDQSIRAIGRLLVAVPSAQEDPEVLFILKKALLSRGPAFAAAVGTVEKQMGQEGAELLYEVMSEHPEQRNRLRSVFYELRKNGTASPQVLIAYDLRYAQTCKARLGLLERAEKFGDVRSLRQLQLLSTAPKRCGWGRTCYPPCRAEAARFKKSADIISARLQQSGPSGK